MTRQITAWVAAVLLTTAGVLSAQGVFPALVGAPTPSGHVTEGGAATYPAVLRYDDSSWGG